jgi:DNA repair exonuclease SbcCD ATPase subunit
MAKIKTINIFGIRGIKDLLTLDLNKNSVLVYGDNGTGKSSLTDAIEWFYTDGVQHLVSEETGSTRGRGALRNLFIDDTDNGYVEIEFTDNKLSSKKSINNNLQSRHSNTSKEFSSLLDNSQSENLMLSYSELVKFIVAKKKEKLDRLQDIIGFSQVAELRGLLQKNGSRIARNIKSANYDNQKNVQQSTILENLGRNSHTDEQLFAGVNELIKPLKFGIEIKSREDINKVLTRIQTKEDVVLLEKINFFTRVWEALSEAEGNVDNIQKSYEEYHKSFTELQKDPEKIKKLQLLKLLKEGQAVLKNDIVQDDYCPLCQLEKSKVELLRELNERIEDLEQLAEEKAKLDEQGEELNGFVQPNVGTLDNLLKEKLFQKEESEKLKEQVEEIKKSLSCFTGELKKDLAATLAEPVDIEINKKELAKLAKQAQETAKVLTESQSSNIKFIIFTKLDRAARAYVEYRRIDGEQDVLTKQQITFELLHEDFIKRQEEALNVFLAMFSKEINDYYTTMNPNEKVENIKLVPLKKNDELVGITIEYSFFDETKTPPIAFLSESHINCLGLSFFLASVKAFNKENEFFILDDVISSFDRSHRARFAKLLTDKFADYQVILLTHEQEFFELVSSDVKSKGWSTKNFKWSKDSGTSVEKGMLDIKERINKKFENRNTDGLGNDIRVFTEKVMKEVAFNIEASVAFRYNEINEKRMAPELLDAVHSRISKKGNGLKDIANIPRVKGMPMFIGNTTSHDNNFKESIEDLEVMWDDIKATIHTFYCMECKKFISVKYFDNVENKIRCGCGKLAHDWKK